MSDLTGANSKILMTFPFTVSPVELEDFTVDESLIATPGDLTNTVFDLEGKPHYSLLYNEQRLVINFLATSPSVDFFIRWQNEMFLQKRSLGKGILTASIFNKGKKYVFTDCALKNNPGMPAVQLTLGNVTVTMVCNPVTKVVTL